MKDERVAMIMSRWNVLADKCKLPRLRMVGRKTLHDYFARCGDIGGEDEFWEAVQEEVPLINDFARGIGSEWRLSFRWITDSEENLEKLINGNYRKSTEKRRGPNI